MTEPFRIFSGWDARQEEAANVFEFSVREHASTPVEIMFVGTSPKFKRQGVTGFTYARFLVPSLCDYNGVALFADGCDQLCLADVAELAAMPMNGYAVRVVKNQREGEARPRAWTSFMLLDCSKFTAWTPEFVEEAPDAMMMRFGNLADAQIGDLPPEWNSMMASDSEPPAGAKLAHWSYLAQPEGNSWVDRSGSNTWAAARQRWREASAR